MKQHDRIGSKEGQDDLALGLCGMSGFFLDLGMGHPLKGNNTIRLEQAGWTGMCFDIEKGSCDLCNQVRTTPAFCHDVARESIRKFLDNNHAPQVIDFISFDVDGGTLGAIELFPFEHYEFKVMCFEHDSYGLSPSLAKDAMIKRLAPFPKYEIFAEDVTFEDDSGNLHAWEDWWINTNYHEALMLLEYKNVPWWKIIEDMTAS